MWAESRRNGRFGMMVTPCYRMRLLWCSKSWRRGGKIVEAMILVMTVTLVKGSSNRNSRKGINNKKK